MVDIAPFRALRPSREKFPKDASGFICPPYDVISADEKKALLKKSPYNVVRIELADGVGDERFSNAASLLKRWNDQGVIQEDRQPSFYLLETSYRISDPFAPTTKLKRYGVLAALRLETPGKGNVRPHEKTLPKAKEERLGLLRAVQTHVSSIFGLFFDNKKEWSSWISQTIKTKPLIKGRESKDLDHRLWKIDNPVLIKRFQNILKSKVLYIADGHHRYEVSWAYKEERLMSAAAATQNGGGYVMTYICPMEEKGLLMLPTHRLVKSDKSWDEWKTHVSSLFDISPVKSLPALIAALKKTKRGVRQIGWISSRGIHVLTLKKNISIDRCLPDRAAALKALDVVLLHDIILEEASGKQYTKDKDLIYTRDIVSMQKLVKKDPSWQGFVLASSGVASLANVSEAGEVMPPKTTYFYPKVPTGFTLMNVNQEIQPARGA